MMTIVRKHANKRADRLAAKMIGQLFVGEKIDDGVLGVLRLAVELRLERRGIGAVAPLPSRRWQRGSASDLAGKLAWSLGYEDVQPELLKALAEALGVDGAVSAKAAPAKSATPRRLYRWDQQPWMKLFHRARQKDPCHAPGGSPEGGQFFLSDVATVLDDELSADSKATGDRRKRARLVINGRPAGSQEVVINWHQKRKEFR